MCKEDDLKIRAIPFPDGKICRFEVSKPLTTAGSICFRRQSSDSEYSLINAIFKLPQIEEVAMERMALIVRKSNTEAWGATANAIGLAIRENLHSTYTTFQRKLEEKSTQATSENHLATKIQVILDDRINPSIASHGGRIALIEVKEFCAYISMEGGCQGCSMSRVTLKNGVEKTLLEEIPELREVVDMTDHSQGDNPYHR